MELFSAASTPVSNTLDPAPPRDSRSLSSPGNPQSPVASQQVDTSQASSGSPDPTARVGGQIDTYV